MKHLIQSFQSHRGTRGCHFYDEENCNFLDWKEVYVFIDALPRKEGTDPFTDRLEETLANYNPDTEFLAVQQKGDAVSVELYKHAQ
jgi:hypothetical protein